MVNVGLVGLGPRWETDYFPALMKLRNRIRVRAVYHAVATQGEQVAEELNAEVSPGIITLLDRSDVQAILLLDSNWYGSVLLQVLADRKKPVYLANSVEYSLGNLEQMHSTALAEGTTLMPGFDRRYTPSTCRLQELMATRLGRPSKIISDIVLPASPTGPDSSEINLLLDCYDWCRYVMRSAPVSVEVQSLDPNSESNVSSSPHQIIHIQFRPGEDKSIEPTAELRLQERDFEVENEDGSHSTSGTRAVRQQIFCQSGSATLDEAFSVSWKNDSESFSESLSTERSGVEVMIDHFCRRVVGGLIPVPNINDICSGLRVMDAVHTSLRENRPVELNGTK